MLSKKIIKMLLVAGVLVWGAAAEAGIKNTRHNLGSSGPASNNNAVSDTDEICVFCHTPHGAQVVTGAPLWNKSLTSIQAATFEPYAATSSLDSQVATTLGGTSMVCLSCHDGSQALDNIINAPGSGGLTSGNGAAGLGYSWATNNTVDADGVFDATAAANIGGGTAGAAGADLSNDHPIGVAYCGGGANTATGAVTCADKDFVTPVSTAISAGNYVFWVETTVNAARDKGDMWLYNRSIGTMGTQPSVECASCHDVHTEQKLFMRSKDSVLGTPVYTTGNSQSAVCLSCHVK